MIQNLNHIYSIIISLLLINGFYNLAYKFSPKIKDSFKLNNYLISTVIIFFFIINFFGIITFNLNLWFGVNKFYIIIISSCVIIFGFYKPKYFLELKSLFKKKDYKLYLIYSLIIAYFLLSMSPITDPDSLEYHLSVPLYQLEFDSAQFSKYWLTSQLSGSGESLFIYGLALDGIHFSQILQFASLFFIVLVILNFSYKKKIISQNKKYLICLILLTMPVFIFLTSSSKPQIFSIATNFLSLLLTFVYLPFLNKKSSIKCFCLIIFLLFCSTQVKFSFFLSSGLISMFATYAMYKKKIFLETSIILIFLFILLIFPREYYEYVNFNKNILYNFLHPTTDIFAADNMNASLKHGTGNNRFLPLWLFVPLKYGKFSLGNISYSLGPFVLYFFYKMNLSSKIIKKITILSLVYFFVITVLAQPVSRFYIEVFLWLLFFSVLFGQSRNGMFNKFFEKTLVFYSFLFFLTLGYFSISLFKGNFSDKLYDDVLTKNADGYMLYKWANNVLPNNVSILSTHRSYVLYKNKVISYEIRLHTNSKKAKDYYLNSMKSQKPEYILYTSTEHNNDNDILKNCRGELYKFKKNVGFTAGRNPFSIKKNFYDGYIYKFNRRNIETCIK